jgi:rRNA maturation endonuclease Nob1
LDKVFEEICDCEYATEMHTALEDKYNVQSVARQVQLQMELQKVYRKYKETFANYYRRARGIQQTVTKQTKLPSALLYIKGFARMIFETHF